MRLFAKFAVFAATISFQAIIAVFAIVCVVNVGSNTILHRETDVIAILE